MSDQGFEHFSGTMPVSMRQQFDIAALATWLSANVAGFAGPLTEIGRASCRERV